MVVPTRSSKPSHVGPTIFPNFPTFTRLLGYANSLTSIAIDDRTYNVKATHLQLLTDALHVRNVLQEQLGPEVREKLLRNEEVYINLWAPASYEYAVGFLAILAIGAIIVPLCQFDSKLPS